MVTTETKFKQTEIGLIPEDWEVKTIKNISTKLGDGLHGTPKYDDNGKYYFINGNNLLNKIVITSNTKKCNENEYEKYKKDLTNRTILVSINGTLGNVATYDGEKVILGKSACYFTVKENFSLEYIKYVVKGNIFLKRLEQQATGTTIKNISLQQMRNYDFGIPSNIDEQKAIAKILSDLDSKIELLQKQNKTLEQIGQTIFKQWFVDFEFPNEEGKPYKSSGGKMIESELGDIPEGWNIGNYGDLLEFERGVEPGSKNYLDKKEEETVLFHRVGDLVSDSTLYVKKDILKNKFCLFEDILVSFDGTVGRVRFGLKGSYSTGIRKVYSKSNKFSNNFIYFLMKSKFIQNKITEFAKGTTILHAGESINHFITAIPDDEILILFQKTTDSLFKALINNTKEIKNLQKIRDLLLPKLMSGQIRVSIKGN
jgi:type I restriction enzyme, S subunit